VTPEQVAAARWFRSKRRKIATVTEVERIPLGTDASLAALEVALADGDSERYLVPAGESWPRRLAEVIEQGESVEGRAAVLAGYRFAGSAPAATAAPAESWRPLGVEQSNTSVVIGEDQVLKLYRLLEPGSSPEVEITAFLATAGFDEIAGLDGWATWHADDGEAAAALLQPLVRSPAIPCEAHTL